MYFPTSHKKNVHADDEFLKKLKLSGRELEVIRLVKKGLTTKEIADQLNISFYTAETHRKNIKLKIGVEGEAAFLRFVYSTDLEVWWVDASIPEYHHTPVLLNKSLKQTKFEWFSISDNFFSMYF